MTLAIVELQQWGLQIVRFYLSGTAQMPQTSMTLAPDGIRKIVSDIDTMGYGCLPNFIDLNDLKSIRSFVKDALQSSSGEYIGFAGPAAVV